MAGRTASLYSFRKAVLGQRSDLAFRVGIQQQTQLRAVCDPKARKKLTKLKRSALPFICHRGAMS